MDVIVDCWAGLDVHKRTVMAAVRTPGSSGRRDQEVREFSTYTVGLVACVTGSETGKVICCRHQGRLDSRLPAGDRRISGELASAAYAVGACVGRCA